MASVLSRFTRKKDDGVLSRSELKKLQSYPRYTPVETTLCGNRVYSNDACTLIGDVRGLIYKGVYRFNTSVDKPVIVDCGANVGISVIYFKRLYRHAVIRAFEPDPVLYSCLEKNVTSFAFADVRVEQKAVWIDNGGVSFKMEGGHSGTIVKAGETGEQVVTVPTIRLKDVLDSCSRIDMLKVDIEGAENTVIFDCGESLSRCSHVFIEYHSGQDEQQKLHGILELFESLGFRYHIQEAFTRRQPFVDRNCLVGMDMQLNLYFYK